MENKLDKTSPLLLKWKLTREIVSLESRYPELTSEFAYSLNPHLQMLIINLDGLSLADEKAVVIRCFTFAVEEDMRPPKYDNHTLTFKGDRYLHWKKKLKE